MTVKLQPSPPHLTHGFVEQLLNGLAKGGMPALLDMCADDIVYVCPYIPGPPLFGPEGVAAVIALMAQQIDTSTFECVRSVLDGCVATLDIKCHHHYKDGSELAYVQRCRMEVHGGLIRRLEGQLLEEWRTGGALPPTPTQVSQSLRNILRVHVGDKQVWVRAENIRYLQAAGKHTLVVGNDVRGSIRAGLSATAARLNSDDFWQIHRGNVINVNLIRASYRDELGRLTLTMVDGPEKFLVSRSHEHLVVRSRH